MSGERNLSEYKMFVLKPIIDEIDRLEGRAPARVRSMVLEWPALHPQELADDWERCRRAEAPLPIAPLE